VEDVLTELRGDSDEPITGEVFTGIILGLRNAVFESLNDWRSNDDSVKIDDNVMQSLRDRADHLLHVNNGKKYKL